MHVCGLPACRLEENIMKKFRLLLATLTLGVVVATAGVSQNRPGNAGGDPVPICPPDGCLVN